MPGSSLGRHLESGVDPGNEVVAIESRGLTAVKFVKITKSFSYPITEA